MDTYPMHTFHFLLYSIIGVHDIYVCLYMYIKTSCISKHIRLELLSKVPP